MKQMFVFIVAAMLSTFAIKAQVANAPPAVTCPADSTNECGALTAVTAVVSDPDGDALTVVWSVNGVAIQTNDVPASTNTTDVSFSGHLSLGTNTLSVTATDTAANSTTCSSTVRVVDTTPPVIQSVSASPNILWPPNHKMIAVRVQARVTDTCGTTTWKITGVTSNESAGSKGKNPTDWQITGDHTLKLRAERAGSGSGRIYTITITAKDASGNTATKTVTVSVPHDQRKK